MDILYEYTYLLMYILRPIYVRIFSVTIDNEPLGINFLLDGNGSDPTAPIQTL